MQDASADLLQPAGAFAAGSALAAGLVGVEAQDVVERLHHVGFIVHHDDAAGTEHGVLCGEGLVVHAHVAFFGGEDLGRAPARDDGLQLVSFPDSAGVVVDQVQEVDTHGHLVGSRAFHVAADAQQLGPGTLRRSDALEPVDSPVEDVGDAGEGLDVVDHCRAAEESLHGRERGLDLRQAALALERAQEPGLFAADIGSGAAVHGHVEPEAGAENVFTENSSLVGLIDGFLHGEEGIVVFAPDIDVADVAVERVGGDEGAFDELVRIAFHDHPVLEGAGFAFIRVDHQVFRLVGVLGDKGPLQAAGKAGSAASPEVRILDRLGDLVGLQLLQDSLSRLVAAMAAVEIERGGAFLVDVFRQNLLEFFRFDFSHAASPAIYRVPRCRGSRGTFR